MLLRGSLLLFSCLLSFGSQSQPVQTPAEVNDALRAARTPFFDKLQSYVRHLNGSPSADPALHNAVMHDEATRLGLDAPAMAALAKALNAAAARMVSTYSDLLDDTCTAFANTMPNTQARDLIRAYDAMRAQVAARPADELLANISKEFGQTVAAAVRARIEENGQSLASNTVRITDMVEKTRGGDYLGMLAEICPARSRI